MSVSDSHTLTTPVEAAPIIAPSIKLDAKLAEFGMALHVAVLAYPSDVRESDAGLEATMQDAEELRRQELLGEAAASDPVIARARAAFKAFGRDPSRYRPSSEALTRRLVSGKDLPRVNTAVDVGNLVSVMTGVPVGLYDADRIEGNISLRLGAESEAYESVRGRSISVHNLAALADSLGPFGTPYSDSKHTAVGLHTKRVLFILYGINLDVDTLEAAALLADQLMSLYVVPQTADDTAPFDDE